MTIRRQYSLPNCTLVLEGLSDNTAGVGNQFDTRPVMTMLVSAECHFSGGEQPLVGGRDFLESLVRSVSHYAQEFLSQVRHPKQHGDKPEIVQLQKLPEKNLHQLTLLPTANALPAGYSTGMSSTGGGAVITQGIPVQMDLTTVQLFDLVEAIDQFLADRQTLPDVKVTLEPLSKRYRQADQPIAKRAAPAAVGVTGLALSAAALFLLPTPQVREPKPSETQPTSTETTSPTSQGETQATGTPKPQPTPPSTDEIEKVLSSNQEITDPTQLRFLERRLYNKVNDAWNNRRQINQTLEYRVAVGQDGAIIGYKPVERTPVDAAQATPLPDLLYIPTTDRAATSEPVAQFRVVFNNRGILQISPWRGYTGKPTLGPRITDTALVRSLNEQLYKQIRDNWQTEPTFPRNLVYRVGVTEEGAIADYEAKNQPASDYVGQTPLEKLSKPEAAGIGTQNGGLLPQKPLAQFRVVFKPDGVIEVSPY